MIRILYIIRALQQGGAERQLIQLAAALDKSRFIVTVATMYDGGELWRELAGVPDVTLVSLHKRGRWDLVPFGYRAFSLVHKLRPDILHSYMTGSNELALLLGRIVGARVVWGLRVADLDLSHYGWFPQALFRLGALLSPYPDLIISNSHAGLHYHQTRDYAAGRMIVIPNGIDTTRFQLDAAAGCEQRRAWGIAHGTQLIGIVGRLDPVKDHPTFLRAAALLVTSLPGVRFVCVGSGPATYRATLQRLATELGIANHMLWVDNSDNMVGVYNALSLLTSTSLSEGFSNVLGEAMACGLPCVATDAGDSAWIMGDTGVIVPPGTPSDLAQAWHLMLTGDPAGRSEMILQRRERVLCCFSLGSLVDQYSLCYEQLLANRA
ncbi:MAG: glycosyltransferase [Herpetosiphonaceae bacterium]|nr:glycosyltransferase [Herpetosiphonaceae bacterium]